VFEFLSLTNYVQNNDVSYTYGCLDPVMVTQMAKYLDTVYVSGWQCSSTASSTDEPGPDLADYPYVSFRFRQTELRY
jgi:isocitrate lyase